MFASSVPPTPLTHATRVLLLLVLSATSTLTRAQTNATLQGRVTDANGDVLPAVVIVGGYVTTSQASGSKVADIVLKIANGARAQGIPVEEAPIESLFDWRELQRWGIREDQLPGGSIVLFANPTFWQQYKWRILVVIALLLFQTSLIAGLLIERTRRWRVTRGLAESEERYRNVVQTQTELICRYLPDTTLTFVNDAYCRYFGKTRAELIGTRFIELIPEQARQQTLTHIKYFLEDPRTRVNENEAILPDGTIVWQQWVNNPIINGNGRIKELQGIGRDITDRKRLEEERLQAENELSQLTSRLFTLQDEERRRIARELHDGTAQNLFAVSIDIDLMRKHAGSGNVELKSLLDESAELCEQSLQEIRTLSYLLHPPLLDQAGLVSALKWYVEGFTKRTGIHVNLVALDGVGRMRSEIETALFRIVQESLTNIRRHSQSETASIRLRRDPREIFLEIRDHGHGINNGAHGTPIEDMHELGVGVPGMRQRLRQLGGRLDITSSASGTLVTAVIPLSEPPGNGATDYHS